jgi:DNA helicase-2/ATP-dependent DNA helicase PcrA
MAWNDGLIGQGLNIAASTESRIRVMAGPGAGKSFSLMRRIARLLESGVNPERILLVTFTRTAAQDLKNDLNKLNVPGAINVNAGTLHSFCFKMLKKEAVLEKTGRHARPLFGFEKNVIINDLSRLSNNIGKRAIEKKINAFEAAWSRLQHEAAGWPTNEEDRVFHHLLIGYLKFHKAMLIGEVIPESLKYLRHNPAAEELSSYDYVFVDEYQDLNKAEQELITLLSLNSNLMIIGDEDQSIYQSFRHANPEGIRTFSDVNEGTVDYPLDECRRCPRRVVKIADDFIQNNQNRDIRHLNPRPQNPDGTIYSVQWLDFDFETMGITEYIQKKIKSGTAPGQILVLSPRRDLGYNLKDELLSEGIEAHSFFTEELFEETRIKEKVCLLNLLDNPEDRIALRVWLSFGSKTLNTPAYIRLYNYCRENAISPKNTLEKLVSGEINIPYTTPIKNRYLELLQSIEEIKGLTNLEVRDLLFPDGQDWCFEIREILENIKDEDGVSTILKSINNAVINSEPPMDVNYVRIMSLHKSKGLTAEIVIIRGMIEGLIPRHSEDEDDIALANLEEQRRLFFVGITRPTTELVISTVSNIPKKLAYQLKMNIPNTFHQHMPAITSSFLNELGENFPNTVRGEEWIETIDAQE